MLHNIAKRITSGMLVILILLSVSFSSDFKSEVTAATTTYTITYMANGGSDAPPAQTKYHNKTVYLSSKEPYRSGYSFVGWGITPISTYATYNSGSRYTDNASITLYAIWEHWNHTWSFVYTVDATCTTKGSKHYTCKICGENKTETIKSTGHNYILSSSSTATCTSGGEMIYRCKKCNDLKIETTNKGTHYKTTINRKKSTYFSKGYSGDTYCIRCNKILNKGVTTNKLKLKTPQVVINSDKDKITIHYTKVTDSTGFQVKYKIGKKSNIKTYNTKESTTKVIKKQNKGTYKVRVRAFIKQGNKIAYSKWTKTNSAGNNSQPTIVYAPLGEI